MQQTVTETNIQNSTIFEMQDTVKIIEQPKAKKWTKDEYYRLADLGFFDGKRVELIEGDIIEMAAMKSPHITSVMILGEILRDFFGEKYHIRTQGALDFGKNSQPEPDVAVVKGKIRDYADAHPKESVLIVEVADTTLNKDRNFKARLYAKNGIEDYWILNLKSRCLEVYRRPIKDKNLGFVYTEIKILTENDDIAPLAKPAAKIKIADILP
ncbi:MAG: Uma2 family endonuclease [Pyrinomonadaceae bacterium]